MQDMITTTAAADKALPVQGKPADAAAGGRSEITNGRSFQQEFESKQTEVAASDELAEGQAVVDESGNTLPTADNTAPLSDDTLVSELPVTDQPVEQPVAEVLTAIDPGWQAYFGSLAPAQGQSSQPGSAVNTTQEAVMRPAANTVNIPDDGQLDTVASELMDDAETLNQRSPLEDKAVVRSELAVNRVSPRADTQQTAQVNQQASEDLDTTMMQNLSARNSGSEGEQSMAGNRHPSSSAALFSSVSSLSSGGAEQANMFSSVMSGISSPSASTLQSTSSPVMQSVIPEAFGSANWSQGLGKQVMMMVNQNMQTAELKMNPAHLGPIEVRIEMEDDQVNVNFTSRHAVVREAMEQALPRLREMLDEQGLNLGGSDISQQSFAEQQQSDGNTTEADASALIASGEDAVAPGHEADGVRVSSTDSLVDYYI